MPHLELRVKLTPYITGVPACLFLSAWLGVPISLLYKKC